MRAVDLSAGFQTSVSNEEQRLLDLVAKHSNSMPKSAMDDRQAEVARNLVNKGVLTRAKIDGKIHYVADQPNQLWRL